MPSGKSPPIAAMHHCRRRGDHALRAMMLLPITGLLILPSGETVSMAHFHRRIDYLEERILGAFRLTKVRQNACAAVSVGKFYTFFYAAPDIP